MIAGRFCTVALLLGMVAPGITRAQAGLTNAGPAGVAPEKKPEDPLGRTTPRGTVRGFLTAEGKEDGATAARYLNTRLQGEAAASLAHQLFVVLNARLPARLNEISDQPEGSLYYPTEPDKDLIGTIKSDNGNVEIVLERIENAKLGSIWLFSRITLSEIPGLYEEVISEGPRSGLSKFLVETKIGGIALTQWLGLFVGLPLLYFLGIHVNRWLSATAGNVLRRVRKNPELPNPDILSMPVRLLLLALIIRLVLANYNLPLLARQFWLSIATLAVIAGLAWLLIRLTGSAEEKARIRLGRLNLTGALSMLRFARSAVNIAILFLALLVVLYYFGINATTALAGLGVGGIAVALAAQKTLENVIAGVSLISDKAIRVGDFLKIGDTQGTVTDIGLRSTRIRTLNRTVVNVPNGQIANASLENMSLRDQFWFNHTIGLTYETTPAQIRAVLDALATLLIQRSDVDKASARARFIRFAASSFEIELFAYIFARDWPGFLNVQQELLLQIMDAIEETGAKIALPSQKTYLGTAGPRGRELDEAVETLADVTPVIQRTS